MGYTYFQDFFSFPTGLVGFFLLFDSVGFFLHVFYWVKRFFHQATKTLKL